MAGERGLQAQRRSGNPFRDLHEVIVGRRGVRPAVDSATQGDDLPSIPEPVKSSVAEPGSAGFPVGEGIAEQLMKTLSRYSFHEGKYTHIIWKWECFPPHMPNGEEDSAGPA